MNWTPEQLQAAGYAPDGSRVKSPIDHLPEEPQQSGIWESTDISRLNKTERAFHGRLKEMYPGDWIGVQCITFKLADDCRYTPDFVIVRNVFLNSQDQPSGVRMLAFETKGFMRDDALVKLKVAARQFSWIGFMLVKRIKGEWFINPVKP